ncbi:unnamed protein product, partial [Laminaria digitata]
MLLSYCCWCWCCCVVEPGAGSVRLVVQTMHPLDLGGTLAAIIWSYPSWFSYHRFRAAAPPAVYLHSAVPRKAAGKVCKLAGTHSSPLCCPTKLCRSLPLFPCPALVLPRSWRSII